MDSSRLRNLERWVAHLTARTEDLEDALVGLLGVIPKPRRRTNAWRAYMKAHQALRRLEERQSLTPAEGSPRMGAGGGEARPEESHPMKGLDDNSAQTLSNHHDSAPLEVRRNMEPREGHHSLSRNTEAADDALREAPAKNTDGQEE